MPTVVEGTWRSDVNTAEGSLIPVVYKGKLYGIVVTGYRGISLVDFYDDSIRLLGEIIQDSGFHVRITDFKVKSSTVEILYIYEYLPNNEIVITKAEINLDEFTVTRTDELRIPNAITHEYDLYYSTFIPPRLLVLNVTNTSRIRVLDIEDTSYEDIDTLLDSTYSAFPGTFYVVRGRELYVALGRWMDNDYFRLIKIFSGSVVDLDVSAVGGKPTINAGLPLQIGRTVIYPFIASGTRDTNKAISFFDKNFNHIANLDLGTLSGYTYNDPYSGIAFLGRLSNGNYAVLISIANNHWNYATAIKLMYVELDSSLNIITSQTLLEINDTKEQNEINVYLRHKIFSLRPYNSDITCRPIIDTQNKIVYLLYQGFDPNTGIIYSKPIYIDISDLDIVEWNPHNWLINY